MVIVFGTLETNNLFPILYLKSRPNHSKFVLQTFYTCIYNRKYNISYGMDLHLTTPEGGGFITEADEEVKISSRKKREKKKLNVREYDPLKDESSEIIGGYSTYIKKKKLLAQNN